MENTIKNESVLSTVVNRIIYFFRNSTVRYIIKRILHAFLTLIILVALVTVLIRLIPDIKLYDIGVYNKLKGQAGEFSAEKYKISQLFQYGRCTLDGKRIPIIRSILQNIYYILPIYKEIPYRWNNRYTEVLAIWKGTIYLGRSMTEAKFLTEILKERMGISFFISITSVFFTYLIGFPLGIAMAKKPGGVVDRIGNVFIVLNYAIPALVFYLFMNSVLGNANGAFGWLGFSYSYSKDNPKSLIPPIFCIVFLGLPGIIVWVRRFMVDELNSDYVKFARSKGLSENRIMYTHVLRNACVPLVRNIPATFLGAIVGSYYIEDIWSINGTGKLLINAIQKSDFPILLGLTVFYATISMASFLLGDILTVMFDPRIKLTE